MFAIFKIISKRYEYFQKKFGLLLNLDFKNKFILVSSEFNGQFAKRAKFKKVKVYKCEKKDNFFRK